MNCNYFLISGMYLCFCHLCLNTDCRETVTLKQTITFISCSLVQSVGVILVSAIAWYMYHTSPLAWMKGEGALTCLQIVLNILEIAELSHQISVKLHPNNNETVRSTEVNSIFFFFFSFKYCYSALSLGCSTVEACTPFWEPWRELLWGFLGGWDSTIWPPAELQHQSWSDSRAHTFSSSCL